MNPNLAVLSELTKKLQLFVLFHTELENSHRIMYCCRFDTLTPDTNEFGGLYTPLEYATGVLLEVLQ
ncbi:hypothetical protein Gasu2_36000 [Galdieria sulphuraria]|uniref:Uncharacterized protein n=1 Tax=Galdieria sulphuraria TaxID=130081 RepID=M2XU32_GALSU|nr:uncharacterized protein Gasu_52750 [Galdieria sulphuraria]EME27173.1 hypothetical protein Gasu_52750 [Galdieria sulphuraria]GJD09343.1 hypothetical protein Gasu2_36000 [Galdieria sulphuraria]|eukprot:XP_005703693.1 hypothetical protein Gasu_52750 [Galdieria sulphuraria]